MKRPVVAFTAAVLLLGACSDDDDTATPTTPPSTSAAASTAVAAPPSLFPSVENFAGQWEQANGAMGELNPDVRPLPLAAADLPVVASELGPMFAIAPSDDTFIGGLVDPATGVVTSVLVGVDPASDLGPSTVRTMLGVTADVSNIDEVVEAYSLLANNPQLGVQSYVASGPNDIAMTVLDTGDAEGDEFVIVTAAPTSDETTALAAARRLTDAVLAELTG